MNIIELISKRHPQVRVDTWDASAKCWTSMADSEKLISKIAVTRFEISGWRLQSKTETVRGLMLRSGTRIVVREAQKFWHNFAQGKGYFYCLRKSETDAHIVVSWANGQNVVAKTKVDAGKKLKTVNVPACGDSGVDLVIEVPPQKGGSVFLGVHKLLDRNLLYSKCVGKGVEIGPGPKPQILPGPHTEVKYIEQATPDQWHKLYGMDSKVPVDVSLWKHYVVGNADQIPAEPGTLDFIFSSHVIEHLANPLGHLAYWGSLLKPGGAVAAIIPDREGCKDFVFKESSIQEIVQEYQRGDMNVQLHHYQRWAEHRARATPPEEILRSGRSIHVHFYTPSSIKRILAEMYKNIGFRKFRVIASQNHKDFFVLLIK